jgi:hypothetical protein
MFGVIVLPFTTIGSNRGASTIMNALEAANVRIANSVKVTPGMKQSVMWRQLVSAINNEVWGIAKWNGALSKTYVEMKKKEIVAFFQATINGKYVMFPDGSQARY